MSGTDWEPERPGWWSRQGYATKVVIVIVVVMVVGGIVAIATHDREEEAVTYHTYPTGRPTTTVRTPTQQVELVSGTLQVSHERKYMRFTGKVKNTGTRALKFVKVRGYALTDRGATVNTDYAYIDSDILAPRATATFTIIIDDPHNEATRGRFEVMEARYAD